MNLINFANLDLFPASSITPNFMFVENSLQKAGYSFSSIFLIMSKVFLTNFFLITFKSLCCCNCSLETFRGKSSESTTPGILILKLNLMLLGSAKTSCNTQKSNQRNRLFIFSFGSPIDVMKQTLVTVLLKVRFFELATKFEKLSDSDQIPNAN